MAISEVRKRFNEAFREARNAGDKTFEFEGRKYTTKLSEESSPKKVKTVTDTGDEVTRLSKRAPAPEVSDMASLIPRDSRAPVEGESASGSELGRNVSAAMNAMGPGRVPTAVALAAREMKANKLAQEAYNTRAATRRAEEGLNAAEAADARRRMMEASFEGGMKRGGKVKKMAKGGMTSKMSSASRRGDGIATKGKTRGRMV